MDVTFTDLPDGVSVKFFEASDNPAPPTIESGGDVYDIWCELDGDTIVFRWEKVSGG